LAAIAHIVGRSAFANALTRQSFVLTKGTMDFFAGVPVNRSASRFTGEPGELQSLFWSRTQASFT
jgi:hypothetical protein